MKFYNYEVTEQGEIMSPVTGRCLSYHVDSKGYCRVRLRMDGVWKTWLVHRVVAILFIPNPDNLPQVNHLDGDKSNNAAANLEWTTGKKNVEHSVSAGLVPRGDKRPNAKFSDEQIREVKLGRSEGRTYYDLADAYGCSYQTIHKICSNQTYTHVT